jgi:hypothetical protein
MRPIGAMYSPRIDLDVIACARERGGMRLEDRPNTGRAERCGR